MHKALHRTHTHTILLHLSRSGLPPPPSLHPRPRPTLQILNFILFKLTNSKLSPLNTDFNYCILGYNQRLTIMRSLRIFTLLLCWSLPLVLPAQTAPRLLHEGSLLAVDFIQPRGDADSTAAARFLKNKYFPELHNQFPDSRIVQLRGERGTHERRDAVLWVYADSSDHAHSDLDATVADPEVEGAFYSFNDGFEDDLSTEYRVIEVGEAITKDWLYPGAILGLHHLQLAEGIEPADFEEFVHTLWAPARADALPDTKFIFLKGVAGARTDKYAYLWIIDTEETRDFYFPSSGEASPMYTDFARGWEWIDGDEYLGKYLAEGQEDEFTDFIVVQ